jgi:hypothetical protein
MSAWKTRLWGHAIDKPYSILLKRLSFIKIDESVWFCGNIVIENDPTLILNAFLILRVLLDSSKIKCGYMEALRASSTTSKNYFLNHILRSG